MCGDGLIVREEKRRPAACLPTAGGGRHSFRSRRSNERAGVVAWHFPLTSCGQLCLPGLGMIFDHCLSRGRLGTMNAMRCTYYLFASCATKEQSNSFKVGRCASSRNIFTISYDCVAAVFERGLAAAGGWSSCPGTGPQ